MKIEISEDSKYKETFLAKWGYKFLNLTLGTFIKLVFIKKVEHRERIPKKGRIIIASNHQSFFDFLCFSAIAGRPVHYLAAERFFKSPLWKAIMDMTGQIKVDRTKSDKGGIFSMAASVLEQDRAFGIFPEGTRSRTGKLQKTFTGVAKFAVWCRSQILPVGIINAFEVWPPNKKFPKFAKKIIIKIGEPIDISKYYDRGLEEGDYRRITDYVMVRIAEMINEEYPFADKNIQI